MKTNQSLNVTVENGYAVFTTADGSQNRYAIQPFASLLRTIWLYLDADYPDLMRAPGEPEITIDYNGLAYRWNITMAHYCFAEGRMNEVDLAISMLVESNEEEA